MHILLGSLSFLALFVVTRQVWPAGILFYQGLGCAVLCAAAQGLAAWRWSTAARPPVAKDALLTLLLAYAFMFTVPTTVDRAYSVRMIQQLASRPEGMSRADMEDWFARHFVAQGGVERRVREQLATGTLEARDGRFVLTERGRWLAGAFGFFQRLFNCGDPA
ncbi:hypothetical protein [Pelomonas cellulosilytica]|uniref:HemN C-terminal domain-containing protein n=1 Tax=Pelomonas cellulosilytica TaxID=2906762 RepID=A0ABS8XS21_9BURK|nr:hypothetical protein [Pelomonas sp. P8]MCE4555519.1 hypothetical protein [Pelomonas sp. P8]